MGGVENCLAHKKYEKKKQTNILNKFYVQILNWKTFLCIVFFFVNS
jgi:hypothetical protein